MTIAHWDSPRPNMDNDALWLIITGHDTLWLTVTYHNVLWPAMIDREA